jgi:crotonobetainyl-CoA:carnitine CoA-transferase CaiB-like acyl-CoA transferase
MADFGAEVIKVEPPEGDAVRTMGSQAGEVSLYAASILRNKHLVSIDLRKEQGRQIVARLADECDVVIENFRPGTLEKWGLGYADLSARNPGLVLVRISGYGQSGPYAHQPGYGVTCEAVSGLREITGDPDRPPARVAVSLTDYITGLYGAFGAVMALNVRQQTGRGQVVDAALYEAAFSFMEPHVPAFGTLGKIATRAGSRLPNHTPNNLYPTQDDRYIHITAGSQSVFRRLIQVMGQPDLIDDERFATPLKRSSNEDDIDQIIAEWTSRHDLTELQAILETAAVPAARIYNMVDIFADPHYRDRDMLVDLEEPDLGRVTVAGVVPKLSLSPGRLNWAGHRIGQDTRTVLRRLLGLTAKELRTHEKAQVIFADGKGEPLPLAAKSQ